MRRLILSAVLLTTLLPSQGVVVRRRVVASAAAPAYSTSCTKYASSSATVACGPMTVPANSAVSCFALRAGTAVLPTGVSDGTNSYTNQGSSLVNSGNGQVGIYTFFDTVGGTRTITATYATASNSLEQCLVHTGLTGTFDKFQGGGMGGTNATSVSSGAVQSLSSANEVLVSVAVNYNRLANFTVSSNWNIRQNNSAFYTMTTADQIVSSATGSNAGSITCSGSNCSVSGGSISGTSGQYCTVSVSNGGGSGATAILTLTGSNAIANGTAASMTANGTGYTSAPTQATLGNGTATCSGTITITSKIGYSNVFSGATAGDALGALIGSWR